MKYVILLAFIGILGALAAAGVFMLKNRSADKRAPRMASALTVRIAVSVALFLFIWLSYLMGWIEPTGLPMKH